MLSQALSRLDAQDGDLYSRALLRSAIVEKLSYRLSDALNILAKAVPFFETSTNHTLKGTFHYEFANVLRRIGETEHCDNYIDRAVIEYTAAGFHFEQAGLARYQGCVENNLALVYLKTNHLAEAHEHLDRAQALFTRLTDTVHLAQVEDTRARVMLAEGAFARAKKIAESAVRMLETGGEQSILAETLTTYGIALAVVGDKEQARAAFERAISVAEEVNDAEGAGIAALTLFEQLAGQLYDSEIYDVLERAHYFLKDTRNTASRNRLTACLYRALSMIHTFRPDWNTFSLEQTLHRHEARYIQMALEDSAGVISRAARLLGLTYQRLQYMLKSPHKELRNLPGPATSSGQHGTKHDSNPIQRSVRRVANQKPETVRILHVEDDPTIAGLVQEIAQQEG
jgi:tetratricopeptide (TPR) repeat protein